MVVPAYPPRNSRHLPRLKAIIADAQASIVLTTSSLFAHTRLHSAIGQDADMAALTWVMTDQIAGVIPEDWQEPGLTGEDLAYLQYTSGSTGVPKGVMISHSNLLYNLEMITQGFGNTQQTKGVIWLPPYHDMGLVGGILQPLYSNILCVLMAPTAFLQRPLRWLQAISRYRATASGGPNFAYDLCLQRITPGQRAALDLSSWEVAFSGAEPVRAETIERFSAVFAECGFRREAFYPCYGLAEATLIVAGGRKANPPLLFTVQQTALEQHCVVAAHEGDSDAKIYVGCGEPLLDQTLMIVHPSTCRPCPADEVGEIWVAGPSVAQGYWRRVEETASTFGAHLADSGRGPFLRTGDLGFIHQGELYITGRLKDLIIIRGLNHYPQDIELTVERAHSALLPNSGAAFSVEIAGEECLVVAQEVERHISSDDASTIIKHIRQAIAEQHGISVYAVALLRQGSIPKTSSGKIQRHACRKKFLEQDLALVALWQDVIAKTTDDALETLQRPSSTTGASSQDIEMWLLAHLARRLRIDASQIDIQEPVTQYGIDSLGVVELKNAIEAQFALAPSLTDFFESASILDLATLIRRQVTTANGSLASSSSLPGTTGGTTGYPLAYNQQALWFLQQLEPESVAYNIPCALRVIGSIDVPALKRAFHALVQRHATLRTTFAVEQGQPVQHIHERGNVLFHEEDCSDEDDAACYLRLQREAHRPFHLQQDALLRVFLLKRSAQEHLLLIVMHHIIGDLWSLEVLAAELSELYAAHKNASTPSLTTPRLQYIDYVQWQRAWVESPAGHLSWRYWQQQCAGAIPPLELPLDHPRPSVQTFNGASVSCTFNEELTHQLKDLAQDQGATPFIVLLAAFQVLLYRYSGQNDFMVGTPTAGRSRADLANLVGYFVNAVPLRADVAHHPTFLTLLKRVRQRVLGALEHQEYPFTRLVEQLQASHDASRSPLFQVLFVLQEAYQQEQQKLAPFALGVPGLRMNLGELLLESVALVHEMAQFDLTLTVAEMERELVVVFQYNTDLFEGTTIERMARHFAQLLADIVEHPTRPIEQLSLLSASEREQILFDWNRTAVDYPQEQCLPELFEQQGERTPEAIAVTFQEQQITYEQLNRRANQLAHYLQTVGVGPEVRVGLCMERSLELVVGLIGILKAGGAYVPLDSSYPQERLAFMLADAQTHLVLTQRHLEGKLFAYQGQLLCLDRDWSEKIATQNEDNVRSGVLPANLAYVIYTSGSTGAPKGVSVTHRNVVRLVKQSNYARLTQDEVFLQLAPISFDASTFEIWGSLLNGARLVIFPAFTPSLQELARQLEQAGITTLWLTAGLFHQMVEQEVGSLARLRQVLAGGDVLSLPHIQKLLRQAGTHQVINGYGPTESTTFSCCYPLSAGQQLSSSVPIGRPISNTQVYVLDVQGQPVPIGVVGELYIGGDGLARGYLHRSELTADRFVPHPWSQQPGERLYKTGDLVRYRTDGILEFVGRRDTQVKVRGFRVELGEIEAVLQGHPAVREAVVLAREDVSGDRRLVAYIVPEQAVTQKEIVQYARQKLPGYMVPSMMVLLEQLPLTANGKLDRNALPAPAADQCRSTSTDYVAARTAVEDQLSMIWQQVLSTQRVGVYDNFFEIGGHSLLATQVISRVRDHFLVEVPLRSLFENPTIAGLAEQITRRQQEQLAQLAPIPRAPRTLPLPLSFGQQRLWFLDQWNPRDPVYNLSGALRLVGPLDISALEASLQEIIQRHEALRTTFAAHDGEPVQVIHAVELYSLPVQDISTYPLDEREAVMQQYIQQEARSSFDLTQGPLYRVLLLRLGEQEHVIALTLHHIIADGWSIGVLIRELTLLYPAFASGSASPLADLPIQYADYAYWQRTWLQEHLLDEQIDYWRRHLADHLPVLELPTDYPRPVVQSFRGANYTFILAPQLVQALRTLSQQHEVTLFMTLLACFQILLARYSGQEDVLVGTPIAGRGRSELEGLIGFFVNTLVLRTDLSGDPSFAELLQRVKEVTLEAYAHQDLPFEQLVEILRPERDLSRHPLIQVMLGLQNIPVQQLELAEVTLQSLPVDSGTSRLDLTLFLEEAEQEIKGGVEYNTDLFTGATIQRMMEGWQTLLEAVAARAEQKISALPALSPAERSRVLHSWNATATGPLPDACIHHLFEEQVARMPDAIAVAFRNQQLTYRALNLRANQLAHYLKKLGVGPETIVGVCVERSLDLLVALLGILKAGGAYLPLDPAYPADRLALMTVDAQVTALVIQEHVRSRIPAREIPLIVLDQDRSLLGQQSSTDPHVTMTPENLAYVIYTSGSTGKPKGVMISHQNVINFMIGMDQRVQCAVDDTLLAVTSISFDISVLELFWTLTRGTKVVVLDEPAQHHQLRVNQPIDFSLFYFASDDANSAENKYRLLLEGARFADQHGFAAVWTPERHFHAFGGLYPNPAVTSAALATITEHIQLRAGSVVLPLHDPIRVAEEWAVVDNLSRGRVNIAFASGWHADDFVFFPSHYSDRKRVMYRQIEELQRLWRGETVTRRNGVDKELTIRLWPRPVQPQLPVWITSAGDAETFRHAGEMGANVLTHLLGQSIEEVAEKIRVYREAREQHGHDPAGGRVALMLHTFIGDDVEMVREEVRVPFTQYLRSSIRLIRNLVKAANLPLDMDNVSEEDMESVLAFAFERYFETSGLFGTVYTCSEMLSTLAAIGVDEVACLIDFGVDPQKVLEHLHHLQALRDYYHRRDDQNAAHEYTLADQAVRYGATLFQCTPSLMRMLMTDTTTIQHLQSLRTVLLGGEALPAELALQVHTQLPAHLLNMYGPSETTVWSTTHEVTEVGKTLPIGHPIANTSIYVLDRYLQPVPIGATGEVYIGGVGVARGYLKRPDQTAERFVPDPFVTLSGARMYRTGDLAHYTSDGTLVFLGRNDQQVKIRGHRIEIGEVESVLRTHPRVHETVVVAREDTPGDLRLVAYLVLHEPAGSTPLTQIEVRAFIVQQLPDYMLPSAVVVLPALPLTPNGKIDRQALPAPEQTGTERTQQYVAPRSVIEEMLVSMWTDVLGSERVGIYDNFFELGGHSLLATQLIARVQATFHIDVPLSRFFAAPSVAALGQLIEQHHLEQADQEMLTEVLAEIEGVSEDELEQLLAQGKLQLEGEERS